MVKTGLIMATVLFTKTIKNMFLVIKIKKLLKHCKDDKSATKFQFFNKNIKIFKN